MVDPRRGDVLKVDVADVVLQLVDCRGRFVLHAVEVPDVEVEREHRRPYPRREFELLVGGLDQKVWLRFDEEQNAFLLGVLDDRF